MTHLMSTTTLVGATTHAVKTSSPLMWAMYPELGVSSSPFTRFLLNCRVKP
jgi:hypothetical protein